MSKICCRDADTSNTLDWDNQEIAIVIPAIKSKFLKATLESIFLQTSQAFHIYIGDDASTDDLFSIVSLFPQEKITYHRFSENLGALDLVAHWKRCLAMIQQESWVWLFSDDDYMDPMCIESFLRESSRGQQKNFYRFNTKKIDSKGNLLRQNILPKSSDLSHFLQEKLSYNIETYIVECIFHRDLIDLFNKLPHTPLGWCFDDLFWFYLVCISPIHTIEGSFVHWRSSDINISGRLDDPKSASKKLEACLIFVETVQSLGFWEKYRTLFERWLLMQFLSKSPSLNSLDDVHFFHKRLFPSSRLEYVTYATLEQKQCWRHHMQRGAHITPQVLYFHHVLNTHSQQIARDAVRNLAVSNLCFRTSFKEIGEDLIMEISSVSENIWHIEELNYSQESIFSQSIEQFIAKNEQSLDIRIKDDLYKIYLINTPKLGYQIFAFLHHLLCDEYSLSRMKIQLETHFQDGIENASSNIVSYALWQHTQWQLNRQKIIEYWRNNLVGIQTSNEVFVFQKESTRRYTTNEVWNALHTGGGILYRTKLSKECNGAFKTIQERYTSSLLCLFFYSFRFLFFYKFGCDSVLLSSPLRNVIDKRFRETIGYLSGGLYSYDKFIPDDNLKCGIQKYLFSLLQAMCFLVSNHVECCLDESLIRVHNGIYINIMPRRYKVSINEEEFSGKWISSDANTFYPLELYIIETESDIFLEYAFNSILYSVEDVEYIHNSLEEVINSIYQHDTFN